MLPRIIDFLITLTSIAQTGALYCLSCTDSISPRHCHTVRKCSDGEVCFTESHTSENGIVLFDTGCAISQTCRSKRESDHDVKSLHGVDPHYHHSRCMECCSSHLCNNKGCGQPGYPSSRGPICFDCQQVSDPMLCDKLKVCEMNQACYLQEELEFGDVYYTSSCINKHACTSSVDVFGKRNIKRCSKCCLADLCNNQCSSISSSLTTTTTMKTTATVNTVTVTRPPTSTTTAKVQTFTGSRGREFLILFMHNYAGNGNLRIFVTADNETEVKLSSSPNLSANIKSSVDKTINITSDSIVTLPFDLTCEYMKIEPKGVIIQTSELSTITIFDSLYTDTNDETLIIPTNKLSNKYLVSSTEPYRTNTDASQFALGALYDRTSINITFKMKNNSPMTLLGGTYRDGSMFSINLGKFEIFQIRHTTDLSGTLITSTKRIAVFSGNLCQNLKGSSSCNHMVTQLPPTNEFDNQYIVPPFYHNTGTLIQVVSENQTFVNCSIGQMVSRFHLNEKEYKNMEVSSNETTVIFSEKPVLVTGFGIGSSIYDCYMTVIPGVNQYVDYYKIIVPGGYTENFISVILPVDSTNYLQINGNTADQYNTVYQNYAVLKKTYNVRTFKVQNGTHVIMTTDRSKFGLIVYGHRSADGYGFAGNFVLP